MHRFWALSFLLFLLLIASLTLACGSGNSRQLQSISISKTVNGQQAEFVATGTFSAPPTTVTPLPVDWTVQLMAPPPREYTYTLTTQPFVIDCTTGIGVAFPVVAYAPPNPNAPISGSASKVISQSASISCD
jgi:hypothetical protein